MEMNGSHIIPADRETVWMALNNPDVLRQAIPGCKELEQIGENQLAAKVVAKVGPVKATFKGEVTLENIVAPESYTITGEGKGGIAGFAKGGANVKLTEVEGGTQLDYSVDAKVGGKLAQLGSRLIDGTAAKLANEFFENFSEIVSGEGEEAVDA
ncbi:CoxG family protein [Pseudahrensia aquimaris]|uniref:CoxG family protein n=1 Tax=Pseudahrensia aquimaris TaxID=744461 RepID=A0ABW3FJR3_9HYPH